MLKTERINLKALITPEQEKYDRDEMNIRLVIGLDPMKIYTEDDFSNNTTFKRALLILYLECFSANLPNLRINPHIEYDGLPNRVA